MKYLGISKLVVQGMALAAVIAISAGGSFAASPLKMNFITHAAFFSAETKQPRVIDPQVFVHDGAAVEAVGPQGIKHVSGLRPALIEQDAKTSMVYTADDKPLGFSLGTWLGATGSVMISEEGRNPSLVATFAGLKPKGQYSLFENHFDEKPVGFTPMDGTGEANSFAAQSDGTAKVSMTLTHVPTHANAVLLVYHSDDRAHGLDRGHIGVDAHHQLIARPE
ncbi:MAG: hypothetical protein ABI407_04560 [Bradyrhizobium sp.]